MIEWVLVDEDEFQDEVIKYDYAAKEPYPSIMQFIDQATGKAIGQIEYLPMGERRWYLPKRT